MLWHLFQIGDLGQKLKLEIAARIGLADMEKVSLIAGKALKNRGVLTHVKVLGLIRLIGLDIAQGDHFFGRKRGNLDILGQRNKAM